MKKNKIKVSVAMICYNHEKYIREALDSIFMQEGDFILEVVIGDDASKDKTQSIIKEFVKKHPKEIKPILRSVNVGVSSNLIDVLNNCTGDYIAFLEGDDYWTDKTKLKQAIDFLEKNKEYSATGHDVEVLDQNKEVVKNSPLKNFYKEYTYPKEFFKYNYIPSLSLVFRRNIFNKNGIKIFNDMQVVMDYTIKTYLIVKGKIYMFNEKMGVYRYVVSGSTSWSSSGLKGILRGYYDTFIGLKNIIDSNRDYEYIGQLKRELFKKKSFMFALCIMSKDIKVLNKYIKYSNKNDGVLKTIIYFLSMPVEVLIYLINKLVQNKFN